MALFGAGLLLWRKAEPPVSPGTAGKKTPPFNVPATPPRQVDPAAFEKQYALRQRIGVFHLIDRLFVFGGGEVREAPLLQNA